MTDFSRTSSPWPLVALTGRICLLVLAPLFLLAGVVAAAYVGGWLLLVGGITDAINLAKSSAAVERSEVLITILKIVAAIPLGAFLVFWGIGIRDAMRDKAEELRIASGMLLTERERRQKMGYHG